MRRVWRGASSAAVAMILVLAAADGEAQLRRRSEGPAAPQAPVSAEPTDTALARRFPFLGTWSGTRALRELGVTTPIVLIYGLENSRYTGVMVHEDGSRAPQSNVTGDGRTLQWEMPNSGGGTWHYAARLVTRDSIQGTFVLRGAPPEIDGHGGTFGLARLPAKQPAPAR